MIGDAVPSDRTGVAIAGRDGALLLHTPGFVTLLGLQRDVTSPDRRLEDILAEMRATHESVEKLPSGNLRCRTTTGRTLEVAFERLIYDRICVCITDISEQRGIEDELRTARLAAETASQAKSRFLATMSHELRTPLNAVIGFSDALIREADAAVDVPMDRARASEFAGAIQEAGQHLLNLINNILDVARIESGRFDLASDLIDLPHMLSNCIRASDATAKAARVETTTAFRSAIPRLRGDERRLRQVIAHLLANAIKFSEAGGKIVVATQIGEDRDLRISVRDNGIGIAAADIERVFEPFQQLDTGLARRAAGAGIGLYFCRALIHAHGGDLTLESSPGEGTTATIRLPHTRLITAPAALELLQDAP